MKYSGFVFGMMLCGAVFLGGCALGSASSSDAGKSPSSKSETDASPQSSQAKKPEQDEVPAQDETTEQADAPSPTTQPASLHIPLDEYPKMDGSTANLPLMASVLSRLAGIDQEQAESLTTCATTPFAYQKLVDGDADILLVYEPAEETREYIDASGVELEFVPIGRDALVFIANESNPVDGLSISQLTDIYTGKITNWKEVGGNEQEIIPFQRDPASGSQALFMKLLMGNTEPMEAPTELYPSDMGELIERLAEYNNEGNALGFSVFYYASYMYAKPGLKFLAVDGVAPSDETIAEGSYPFLNDFYVVYRKEEPSDSPVRKIASWLTSEEGKDCLRDAGYVPLPTT